MVNFYKHKTNIMKKIIIILVLVALGLFCQSQETINLNFDSRNKNIIENTHKKQIKAGENYNIIIHGINTAVINSKVETNAYILSSSVPEIIKPIFSGIPDESNLNKDFETSFRAYPDSGLYFLYLKTMYHYGKLQVLKNTSDELYKKTKNKPDTNFAKIKMNKVKSEFNVQTVDEALKQHINSSIHFINASNELYKKKLENTVIDTIINKGLLDCYAQISLAKKSLESDNYLRYFNFIKKSQNSKNYSDTIRFKAEKDVVDLDVTFIDAYAKDTLINTKLSFYTMGNWSFDFTSGFFFNNVLEDTYYLTERDSTTNHVNTNEKTNIDVSFGALGNFSYKFRNDLKFGANVGAALSPLDGKMRYLVGLGFLVGRKKQLGINFGFVFAKIKALSGEVNGDDKNGYFLDKKITSVPTYDKLDQGYFIGITYNLTSTKE